eukprot:TRINITY_DN8588_c0_g1_i1.p1 TRINITY_DN8588_c0_g1~~TRINITY_DN8588_c0_g1_i1.p1  ORF type:complete len:219 (+),score=17.48 TRINITY_DN8588_c0_g1_i1:47-703(+)
MAHPHFVTGEFKSHPVFLPDDEYAKALDCLVKATCDIILTSEQTGQVLVGKRKVEPCADWWFVGGRMKPGERVEQACARLVSRELSIPISDWTRFKTVGHYSFVWDKRVQVPVDHGTADIATHLTIALTAPEIAQISLDLQEYEEFKWVEPSEILTAGTYHPAMVQSIGDMLSKRRFAELEAKALDSSVSDADVRKLLVDFIKRSNYSSHRDRSLPQS